MLESAEKNIALNQNDSKHRQCKSANLGEGFDAGPDRDREPEIATAPVACSHCGGVLRLVREIPRRQEPLSARAPPRAPPPCGVGP